MARAAVNTIGGTTQKGALTNHIRKVYSHVTVRDGGGLSAAFATMTTSVSNSGASYNLLVTVRLVAENSNQVVAIDYPYGEYAVRLYKEATGSWTLGEFIKVYEYGNWNVTGVTGTLTASTIEFKLAGTVAGASESATVIIEAIAAANGNGLTTMTLS